MKFFNQRKSHPASGDPGELAVFMGPCEFSQLLAVLNALAPSRCLEWGSGGSTKAVLERCSFVDLWVSIEHDAAWYRRVREAATDPRLSLHLVEPDAELPDPNDNNAMMAWDDLAEEDPAMMARYVGFPRTVSASFDFVLVDGRARRFCLREGFKLLREGGAIMVHDAQREEYHDVLHELGDPAFFEPYEDGQLCLVRKQSR